MEEKRARTILTSEKVALQLSLTLQLLQLLSGLLGFGAIGIFLLHLLQKSGRCARLLTRQRHILVSGVLRGLCYPQDISGSLIKGHNRRLKLLLGIQRVPDPVLRAPPKGALGYWRRNCLKSTMATS